MKKDNGILYILAGIVLFLLRYVPIFGSEIEFIDKRYSLDQGIQSCGTFLGGLSNRCSWMEPLNVIVIVFAIGLIAWGGYILHQQKK